MISISDIEALAERCDDGVGNYWTCFFVSYDFTSVIIEILIIMFLIQTAISFNKRRSSKPIKQALVKKADHATWKTILIADEILSRLERDIVERIQAGKEVEKAYFDAFAENARDARTSIAYEISEFQLFLNIFSHVLDYRDSKHFVEALEMIERVQNELSEVARSYTPVRANDGSYVRFDDKSDGHIPFTDDPKIIEYFESAKFGKYMRYNNLNVEVHAIKCFRQESGIFKYLKYGEHRPGDDLRHLLAK